MFLPIAYMKQLTILSLWSIIYMNYDDTPPGLNQLNKEILITILKGCQLL